MASATVSTSRRSLWLISSQRILSMLATEPAEHSWHTPTVENRFPTQGRQLVRLTFGPVPAWQGEQVVCASFTTAGTSHTWQAIPKVEKLFAAHRMHCDRSMLGSVPAGHCSHPVWPSLALLPGSLHCMQGPAVAPGLMYPVSQAVQSFRWRHPYELRQVVPAGQSYGTVQVVRSRFTVAGGAHVMQTPAGE